MNTLKSTCLVVFAVFITIAFSAPTSKPRSTKSMTTHASQATKDLSVTRTFDAPMAENLK